MRRDGQDHVGGNHIAGGGLENLPQHRDIAQSPHLLDRRPVLGLNQTGEHHALPVLQRERGLRSASPESELLNQRIGLKSHQIPQPRHFELQLEGHVLVQMDDGLHRELDAGVLEFNRRHRGLGGQGSGHYAGNRASGGQQDRTLVADVDL